MKPSKLRRIHPSCPASLPCNNVPGDKIQENIDVNGLEHMVRIHCKMEETKMRGRERERERSTQPAGLKIKVSCSVYS